MFFLEDFYSFQFLQLLGLLNIHYDSLAFLYAKKFHTKQSIVYFLVLIHIFLYMLLALVCNHIEKYYSIFPFLAKNYQ